MTSRGVIAVFGVLLLGAAGMTCRRHKQTDAAASAAAERRSRDAAARQASESARERMVRAMEAAQQGAGEGSTGRGEGAGSAGAGNADPKGGAGRGNGAEGGSVQQEERGEGGKVLEKVPAQPRSGKEGPARAEEHGDGAAGVPGERPGEVEKKARDAGDMEAGGTREGPGAGAGAKEPGGEQQGTAAAGDGPEGEGGKQGMGAGGSGPGSASGCTADVQCAASATPCQAAYCDLTVGRCDSRPVVDGAGCDDGSACTVADRCQAGVCAGVPKDCDDGIACTTDSCDPVTGECLHVGDCCLNIAECEDEDPCTIDICEATTNKCMYEQIGCDDADPCTDDWCEPFVGCRHTSNTSCVLPCDGFAQCDDGNLCTEDECDPLLQQCVHYTVDCHDTDWCTQDFCVPDEGCRHVQVAGCQHCESDAQCTLPENQCISAACDPEEMQCKYAEKKCDDGDPCTADYCIPETGACAADYVCCEKDADCDPGNACTTGKCAEGKCKLTPISCDDKNPCTLDSCDLRIGCFHEVIKGCR